MTISTRKTTDTGSTTTSDTDADNKYIEGTLSVNSTVTHNDLKSNVEHSHLNSSVTSSLGRGSAEVNLLKAGIEGNLAKAALEFYALRYSYEYGKWRKAKSEITSIESTSTIKKSESHSSNIESDVSFTQHLGKRVTLTAPPYFDVAIIDAGTPNVISSGDEHKEPGSLECGKNWYKTRLKKNRTTDEDLNNTNFIFVDDKDISVEAKECLENLPEWTRFKNIITTKDEFTKILNEHASPVFPGVDKAPFSVFKGSGLSLTQAKELGATCRLQVSHGANQTIQIFSNALRTIRFNAVTTLDNGQNNQIYLGGKYEHIRGRASKLVEGSFIQHHKKIDKPRGKTDAGLGEPNNGIVKYRFEDEASFAFVKVSDKDKKNVENLWALKFDSNGAYLGDVKGDGHQVDKEGELKNGFSVGSTYTSLIHNECIKITAGKSVVLRCQDAVVTLDDKTFKVGDLEVNGVVPSEPHASIPKRRSAYARSK